MAAPQAVLEDYFDFLDENTIRIKGRRVGIELILEAYKAGAIPEEIAEEFDTIRLEDVYATIIYYLCSRERLGAWLARIQAAVAADMARADQNHSPAAEHMRRLSRQARQQPL
jgi:hypothetical protein